MGEIHYYSRYGSKLWRCTVRVLRTSSAGYYGKLNIFLYNSFFFFLSPYFIFYFLYHISVSVLIIIQDANTQRRSAPRYMLPYWFFFLYLLYWSYWTFENLAERFFGLVAVYTDSMNGFVNNLANKRRDQNKIWLIYIYMCIIY